MVLCCIVFLILGNTTRQIGRPEVTLLLGPLRCENDFTTLIDPRCALGAVNCRRTTLCIFPKRARGKHGSFENCCNDPGGAYAYDYDGCVWVNYSVWYAKHLQQFDAFSSCAPARMLSDILDTDFS